jgi:hypothetical protein
MFGLCPTHAGTVPLSSEQEKHALSQRVWQPLSTSPLAVENYDELLAFATDTAVQAVLVRVTRQLQAVEAILRTATLRPALCCVLDCSTHILAVVLLLAQLCEQKLCDASLTF